MPKIVQQPYYHTNPPDNMEDWPRWLDDELRRIEEALKADPVILAVSDSGSMGIDILPTTQILGLTDTPLLDIPSGSWDPITAVWTCPLDGIYSVSAQVFIDPFGPGNKAYFASIECNELLPTPQLLAVSFDGGDDDVPLGIALSLPLLILAGTDIQMSLIVQHEQFTGTIDYNATFSYLRSASA